MRARNWCRRRCRIRFASGSVMRLPAQGCDLIASLLDAPLSSPAGNLWWWLPHGSKVYSL